MLALYFCQLYIKIVSYATCIENKIQKKENNTVNKKKYSRK